MTCARDNLKSILPEIEKNIEIINAEKERLTRLLAETYARDDLESILSEIKKNIEIIYVEEEWLTRLLAEANSLRESLRMLYMDYISKPKVVVETGESYTQEKASLRSLEEEAIEKFKKLSEVDKDRILDRMETMAMKYDEHIFR